MPNKTNPEYQREWRRKNPEKARASTKRYREQNKAKVQNWERKYRWKVAGIEPTRPMPAACECCGAVPDATLHADHDHVTGEFRGWLCRKCNMALGLLGDTIDGVLNAVSYLGRN